MSAQPGAYERSVIMLRDERQLQRQAYDTEIVKIFYQRAAEESILVSRVEKQGEAYADPRITSLKTSGSLEYTCLLYFYDKKSFTKTKVIGCKYSNGEFEVKEGGCMTSKVTKVIPCLSTPLVVEPSASPLQKQVLWEGRYQYRVLFFNEKQTQLHGVYSDQEFDLLKMIANLENRRVKDLTSQPRNQSLVHFMRKEMPAHVAVAKAELLYQALMDLLATSEFFIEKQNNYDSVIADDEAGFQTESRVPTTPGLQRRTTGVMDDRSLEGDSMHEAGSYFGNQSAGLPGLNLQPKAQSDFVMSKRSQFQLDNIANSRFDKGDTSASKVAPLGLDNPQEMTYVSMVRPISPNTLDQHVEEPKASMLSQIKASEMAGRSFVPDNSQTQVSTLRSAIGKNPGLSVLNNPTKSIMKKNPHPFTVESHESTLKSELIIRPAAALNPSTLPKPASPRPDNLTPPQRNGTTRNTKVDTQSRLAGDPYANGAPTMGSELNFKSRVGYQHSNYFQAGSDKARGAFLGAQSGSELQSNLLLDFRQPLSTIDEHTDPAAKRTVLVSSMAIPACIDYSGLSLLLLCRGVTRVKVPGTTTENIKVRSNLLKRISLEGACRGVLPEFNHFLVAINQKVTVDAYSTEMDFFELLLASKDEKMVYGSVILRKEFLEKLDSERVPFSVPIVLEELEARKLGLSQGKAASIDAIGNATLVVFVNLLPGELAENMHQDKKSKQLSQQACRVYQSVSQTKATIAELDRALSSSIKNRKTDELRFLLKISLPPNVLLMIWLLVTKKFRLMKNALSSSSGATTKGLNLFDPMEKLKSAIMQSMYSTKKELGELELNNRVSVHFHRLLRTLDKQGVLSNAIQYYSLSSTVSSLKGEYFKSGINRYKLMEFIFSRIMADYFDMYLADPIQQTHLSSSVVGPAKRNALLTRGFRGCSRDHLVLHIYINNHCQRTAKAVQLNSKDFVIWIVDHILSVNIGLLRDHLGSEHLHFLFSQSIQHKDDPHAQFGWLINLMLHVFILERVEKLLSDRVIIYCEKGSAVTPEQLYGTVLGSSGLIYQDFIQKYLLFESWLAERRSKIQQTSLIGNFFNNLAKSTTEGTSKPGMESMWTIYEDCLENPDIQKLQLKNQQENITILQLCKLEVKPSRALNLLKSEKKVQTRRIVLRIHGVLNKDYPHDEYVFHALCDAQEPDSSSKASRSSQSQEATFTFNHSGTYAPIVQLQLQVVGDELLYRHNTMIVGTKNLQLRRFQPNTVHNLMLEVFSEPRSKVYFVKTSILVQEISKDAGQPPSSDREGVPECLKTKYLGQQGFLLMDNFKHPITNFESLLMKHLHGLFDDLGMDITDCYTGGRFRSYSISGYHLQGHPEGKTLKLSEDELRSELDTFQSSLKVLLFKNQFEMLEDYIIRYFGSDQNSITASEVVYVLQSIFKVLGVRTHLLEVVAYVEGIIKREISPKLDSFSLLLGMDGNAGIPGPEIGKSKYIDLKRHVIELISYLSIKKNSAALIYGDKRSLFLLKDFVEKMRLEKHLTNTNFVQIKHRIDGGKTILSETIKFNSKLVPLSGETHQQGTLKDGSANMVTLDDLLESQQYFVSLAPSESLRVSKSELRRLLTQLPLVEYVRFCIQSLKA